MQANTDSKGGILPESPKRLPFSRRGLAVAALSAFSLLGVVAATAVVPGYDQHSLEISIIEERLPVPAVERIAHSDLPFVVEERIQSGDTIQTVLRRLGVEDQEAYQFIINSDLGKEVARRLRAGRSVVAMISADNKIVSITLPISSGPERFVVERRDGQLIGSSNVTTAENTLVEMRSGTITHSLFGATDAAGVPDSVASKFAEIFGTQIDFSRDLRAGDRFNVVYETAFHQGTPVSTGRILAAEFVNQGKSHTVVLYREADGNEAYYTPDGKGLNQAFLRYPLEFSRISSNFGRRLHPIHRNWRSHNGTDFAARTGTPIKASSDGRVKFVGDQRGYGKTVIIEHRNGYSTLYAHMNGFASGIKNGMRVRQGDVIGYVGQTGWATGPHLHYEIRVNNVPHDPMKIALPMLEPLGKQELASFKQATTPLLERLSLLNYSSSAVAQAD